MVGTMTDGEVEIWEVGGRMVTIWCPEESHWVNACTVVVIWVLVVIVGLPYEDGW